MPDISPVDVVRGFYSQWYLNILVCPFGPKQRRSSDLLGVCVTEDSETYPCICIAISTDLAIRSLANAPRMDSAASLMPRPQ